MKHFKSLRNKSTLLLLFIITISALITGTALLLLIWLRVIPSALMATVWMGPITVLVGCIIGAVLAAFAMRFFIKPVDGIVEATKKIAEGDFSVRIDYEPKVYELSLLVDNFNRMAHELQGTEMFRSDFINNFSHEFKTPIVSIRGFAKQLLGDNLTDEERKQYAEIIASESERLAMMATNILLLSKLENQQLIPDKKEYSLDEQLRRCVLLFETEWEKKNIELDIDLEDITYIGNEEIMSHVWINLFSNAIKYTPENGRISVRMYKTQTYIITRIKDSGIGMASDIMEHIFDKFYQGDSSHASTGNGLGLPLVKRITELCDGMITVDSEEGSGTVFTVFLPL